MDKIDRKILSLLQENARYPLKYLAQKVFLSSPAVSTRIERLEKAGILTGYHATIDPVALGYHITAFINLTLDPKQKDEFYPYVKDCPNVLECNCVTGTYSIMLKVAFPSTMELDTFIGHLQRFGNTQTQIVFSTAVPPACEQMDLFVDYETMQEWKRRKEAEQVREKKIQSTVLDIKRRFGKNAILKGTALEDGATSRERNQKIGGH